MSEHRKPEPEVVIRCGDGRVITAIKARAVDLVVLLVRWQLGDSELHPFAETCAAAAIPLLLELVSGGISAARRRVRRFLDSRGRS